MVVGQAVHDAVALSHAHSALSIGLHWDVWGEDEREFDTSDVTAVRVEFRSQLARFTDLMGCLPTHVDAHRHAHRTAELLPVFQELVAPLGVPLRWAGPVRFVGGFYAQWKWMETDLAHVSVDALEDMLRSEVGEGWTEFSCHPGYVTPDFHSIYHAEREAEVYTLTTPRMRTVIDELNIRLVSYHDWKMAQ